MKVEALDLKLEPVPVFDDTTGVGQPMTYVVAEHDSLRYISAQQALVLTRDFLHVVDAGSDPIAAYTPYLPIHNQVDRDGVRNKE
ncbi:hypothetical protein HYT55_00465 [Candidatus Woesearchaeota archaeon]|nr:hypothetical protein [Candidatus Woesearchaeota archaeon]